MQEVRNHRWPFRTTAARFRMCVGVGPQLQPTLKTDEILFLGNGEANDVSVVISGDTECSGKRTLIEVIQEMRVATY
jgi:hypothetical protein